MFKFTQHKLKNGLTVFYCQTQNHVEFEISMHIKTGARNESQDISGISHFLEHMMFRGSHSHPNSVVLARELEKFGGEINAQTSIEHTVYWMKGDSEKLLEAIPCFSEFFLCPNFADIELERGVILQELASDYNDAGSCIDVDHLAMKAVFQNHPLGNSIIGCEESVKRISIQDLNTKRAQDYVPNLCILTIYSSQAADYVLKAVEKNFDHVWDHTKISTKPPYVNQSTYIPSLHDAIRKTKNSLSLQNNIDNQFLLKLVFPTAGGLSESVIKTIFLQRILDDGICTRLPGKIREQHGLVYDISCDTQFFNEIGVLSIDLTISDDRLSDLFKKMSCEFQALLFDKPTREEIEHIRYRYLFELKLTNQSPSRFLNRQVNASFMNSQFSLEEESESIKKINAKMIHDVAINTFVQNNRGIALVGPKAKKQRNAVENFMKVFGGYAS